MTQAQEPQAQPQLNPQFIIEAQQEELNRVNDNRVALLALLRQKDAEHQGEVVFLQAQIDSLRAGQEQTTEE